MGVTGDVGIKVQKIVIDFARKGNRKRMFNFTFFKFILT